MYPKPNNNLPLLLQDVQGLSEGFPNHFSHNINPTNYAKELVLGQRKKKSESLSADYGITSKQKQHDNEIPQEIKSCWIKKLMPIIIKKTWRKLVWNDRQLHFKIKYQAPCVMK